MHDIKTIRDNPQAFDKEMMRRGITPVSKNILALDKELRALLAQLQNIQEERNKISKDIGIKKSKGEETASDEKKVAQFKQDKASLEERIAQQKNALHEILSFLPNILSPDVPQGEDESDNEVVKTWGGTPVAQPHDHVALGAQLGMMDFERAAQLSGARFVILRGALARLQRALAQFMLETHVREHGYEEIAPPVLVRPSALYGTGQLPKFGEDLYQTENGWYLSPTGEVQLANLVAGQTLPHAQLPLRLTTYTQCFRSEAGAAGRDTKGMIRQHQFGKVELVSITTADQSLTEHERMTQCAETILKKLKLPYRKVVLCSKDTGFSAQKTYDLEVWMAGQNCYREISSSSNCGDFQARRLNATTKNNKERAFVHTLNASGVAIGRALIAVMEYYQQKDGSIQVPDVLQSYLNSDTIKK